MLSRNSFFCLHCVSVTKQKMQEPKQKMQEPTVDDFMKPAEVRTNRATAANSSTHRYSGRMAQHFSCLLLFRFLVKTSFNVRQGPVIETKQDSENKRTNGVQKVLVEVKGHQWLRKLPEPTLNKTRDGVNGVVIQA